MCRSFRNSASVACARVSHCRKSVHSARSDVGVESTSSFQSPGSLKFFVSKQHPRSSWQASGLGRLGTFHSFRSVRSFRSRRERPILPLFLLEHTNVFGLICPHGTATRAHNTHHADDTLRVKSITRDRVFLEVSSTGGCSPVRWRLRSGPTRRRPCSKRAGRSSSALPPWICGYASHRRRRDRTS